MPVSSAIADLGAATESTAAIPKSYSLCTRDIVTQLIKQMSLSAPQLTLYKEMGKSP